MRKLSLPGALASAALLALAAPALAQDDLADRANELAEQANDVQQQAGALANEAADAEAVDEALRDRRDGDDDFPWGLLGLLGLAGLLGLRKPDRAVRVDDRRV